MKHLSFLALAIALVSVKSFGIFDPTWERPIQQATLTERDANGKEINVTRRKDLTLSKRDRMKYPTSITFVEEVAVRCLKVVGRKCPPFIERTKVFRIQSMKKGPCNRTIYVGRELIDRQVTTHSDRIELTDNQAMTCDQFADPWEVTISPVRGTKRFFTGKPHAVITIQ